MKSSPLLLGLLLSANILWFGCSTNSEEPAIDCSTSKLVLSVIDQTDADCSDPGSITVQALGGTPPYLYSSDGFRFQGSGMLDNLFAGEHVLMVRDAVGCMATAEAILEGTDGSITISLDFTRPDCNVPNGTITATVSGGVEPYVFMLNGTNSQASSVFTGVSNGLNTVLVSDAEDCQAERNVVVVSKVSFAEDVFPLILANCAITGCHDGSRVPDFRESAGIMAAAERIKARITARTMPPSDVGSLSDTDIDKIVCWIEDGIPDN